MATASKREEKTFYFNKQELQQLKDSDIEKRIDAILGRTWEVAKRYFNDNGGYQMQNILDAKKQTIGFRVYTIDDPYATSPEIPDEIIKVLNNPPPIKDFEEFMKFEKIHLRVMYRNLVLRPYE